MKTMKIRQGELAELERAIYDMKHLLSTGELQLQWARPVAFEKLTKIENLGWEVVAERINAGATFLEAIQSSYANCEE